MTVATAVGLALAAVSTTLTNVAYLREHDAAAQLPALSMRRPLHSAQLLLEDRSWLLGFAMESAGFLLYAAALALASLALVQSIAAGAILLWLGITAAVALVMLGSGRRGVAVADGAAGGLFFSIGDISTKVATEGGARIAFAVPLIVGYTLGTALLQLGYQAGGAVTVAGIATLLTNALPIAAGTVVLHEPVPGGVLGAVRVLAFVAVIVGAVLLAQPEQPPAEMGSLDKREPR